MSTLVESLSTIFKMMIKTLPSCGVRTSVSIPQNATIVLQLFVGELSERFAVPEDDPLDQD